MGKDNGVNFSQKFTTYLSQNIKLDDLLNEKEKNKAKLKDGLTSVFNNFDTGNKDGELDSNEIENIIKTLDTDKNKNISDEEIKAYCEANGIDKKYVKTFVERIGAQLPGQVGRSGDSTRPTNTVYISNGRTFYDLNSTKYGNEYIKYDTTVDEGTEKTYNSAIYDIKNDKLLPQDKTQPIEIIGVKKFQELTFKDGKFNKPDFNFKDFPKLVIKGADGKNIEIEIKITDIDMSSMRDTNDYMFLMTNLTNSLSNLPPNVLKDLQDNVKYINLKRLEYGTAGTASSAGNTIDEYREYINLDVPDGFNTSTLTHEIGHTVDNSIVGYASEQDKEELNTFIDNLKKSITPGNLRRSYALKNLHELFAEYYTYNNLKDKGGSHLKETNQLFGILDRSIKDGDPFGWGNVKKILDGVKDKSIAMTENYKQKATEHETYFAELNQKENAIPENKMEEYDNKILWDAYNSNNVRTTFERILEDYPSLLIKYQSGSQEEQLAVVNTMRNHPTFKSVLEDCFKGIDADKAEQKRLDNLPFDEALTTIEQRFNSEQAQKLNKNKVGTKIDNDPNVLTSNELREVIINICSTEKGIPKSIRDKFQEGSTEEITKEIVLALRNQSAMWYFLVVDKNYFKHN